MNQALAAPKLQARRIPETGVSVGVAYSPYFTRLAEEAPNLIDYVEVPFELLLHTPEVMSETMGWPIVLHCASLSIAGTVAPDQSVIASVCDWIRTTNSPWLGEHLAFILAEPSDEFPGAEPYAAGQPYNIGYTASPPMNAETLQRVVDSVKKYVDAFGVPLILENSPLYFETPGSTFTQVDFVNRLCELSPVGLLLDLTHFLITSRNQCFDPIGELAKYPLDRVIEVHISGTEFQEGVHWDNHASPVPEEVFDLLEVALRSPSVRAVTLEYNWISRFPQAALISQLSRVRSMTRERNRMQK